MKYETQGLKQALDELQSPRAQFITNVYGFILKLCCPELGKRVGITVVHKHGGGFDFAELSEGEIQQERGYRFNGETAGLVTWGSQNDTPSGIVVGIRPTANFFAGCWPYSECDWWSTCIPDNDGGHDCTGSGHFSNSGHESS